jgi:tRNA(fMet)-specific endonuclease VapC
MKVMLDTNLCIALIRRRPRSVLDRLQSYTVGDVGLSVITLAELEYGVMKSSDPRRNGEALHQFLEALEIVPFDSGSATRYGRIRTDLERHGLPIGAMDLLIAAHALALKVRLATSNTREFARVPGLQVEDWMRAPST